MGSDDCAADEDNADAGGAADVAALKKKRDSEACCINIFSLDLGAK
jgi:hypothetical protein